MELNPLPPDQDKIEIPSKQLMSKRKGFILIKRGHTPYKIDKKTREVTPIAILKSTIQKVDHGLIKTEFLRHKASADSDYFYTSALNEKNALRHFDQSMG